jgi:hypothetical protein
VRRAESFLPSPRGKRVCTDLRKLDPMPVLPWRAAVSCHEESAMHSHTRFFRRRLLVATREPSSGLAPPGWRSGHGRNAPRAVAHQIDQHRSGR